MRLIVTEKPSVGRDIARVLGAGRRRSGYIDGDGVRITWCVGHLVELVPPDAYDPSWRSWRLETLPMLPDQFALRPREDGASDQWTILREQLRDPAITEVVNACDAGREGELIFAYAYELSGATAPVQRLWISSLTDEAIGRGLNGLRPAEELAPLEAAARCRSEADWLVGMNATRAMTIRNRGVGGDALLSVGRVQTPTLAMLCVREDEIDGFEPRPFWQVKRTLRTEAGEWEATWTQGKRDRFDTEAEAQAVLDRTATGPGEVTKSERKTKREKPPLLYDLTTLQREANRRLDWSAAHTLTVAQSLYETHKLLTYPRTDSRHLSQDMVSELPGVFGAVAFGPYEACAKGISGRWPLSPGKRVVDDGEVGDHHAIIPTPLDARRARLSADEKRLYDLVVRRFLAVFLADAQFAATVLETRIARDLFVAKGRMMLEPGWQTIDPPRKPKTAKPEAELPRVDVGESAEVAGGRLHEGQTKPPQRFTEGSLLGAMERAGEKLDEAALRRAMKGQGLGTPATRAAIIETLLRRGYVVREKKALVPTARGRALVAALPVEALRSPRLTGGWEARLAKMAEGHDSRADFMDAVRSFTAQVVGEIVGALDVPAIAGDEEPDDPDSPALADCLRCGKPVRAARRGWRCSGCGLKIWDTVAGRKISPRMARALVTTGQTAAVKGFRSREGKPFTAALVLGEDGKVGFHFPDAEPLGDCPACGLPVRSRGKVFSCDTGRECPFVVFAEMSGQKISEAAVVHLLGHGQSGLIEGFRNREGDQVFDGVLKWTGQRVDVVRVDARELEDPAGACPTCGGGVRFSRGRWRCDGCPLVLPGKVMERPIRRAEATALLVEGRTARLYGFRQKGGAYCKATLVLGDDGKVNVDFSKPEHTESPPDDAAFGKRVDCPLCIGSGRLDPGYLIGGKQAWGCSAWAAGCSLRVPYMLDGREMAEGEVAPLFGKSRRTRYLKGFLARDGLPRGGTWRVVIDPDAERGWRLDEKG